MISQIKTKKKGQKGFSLPEVLIVLLIIAILIVLAIPRINASRRIHLFSAIQQQITKSLNEARQSAISQRNSITFRYNNANKQIIIYGGSFGVLNDVNNPRTDLANSGLPIGEIVYGIPAGASTKTFGETSNIIALEANIAEITFQPDGSVVDADNNPVDKVLFFCNAKSKKDTAFAISVSGVGGKTKVWRYSKGVNAFVE